MILPSMMKFQLGRLVITPAALAGASVEEICYAVDRHVCGIWGDVSDSARIANENALASHGPLRSVYRVADGAELRVLTTSDRLTTTVDLPGECAPPMDTVADTKRDTSRVMPGYRKYWKIGLNCEGIENNTLTTNCSAI